MNPAFSVIVFTTIAGAAQGLVVALALAVSTGLPLGAALLSDALATAVAMLAVGLGASFLHLGRPERAWRAAMMWRTSWLSREVIVLPAFIAVVALWWLGLRYFAPGAVTGVLLPLVAIAIAALLWYCTAMIYACLRFIEEWAHPLTLVNFVVIGLASGCMLASAFAAWAGEGRFLAASGPAALLFTLAAGVGRVLALRRNAILRHRSTLQSATGIHSPHLVQKSMGMSAGSFNTREFFHHASLAAVRQVKAVAGVLGFVMPAVCSVGALATGATWPWAVAVALQAAGIVADRWLFFAQAKHPQNLYYQAVS